MRHTLAACLTTALVFTVTAPLAGARGEAGTAFRPTRQEQQLALRAAEQSIKDRGLRTESPTYLVSVELVHEKHVPDRQALVTHYRTEGDLTILTTVNLATGAVTHAEAIPHLPTALSKEEADAARRLTLLDTAVKADLAAVGKGVELELMVTRPASSADPLFGHRLVRVLFRVGEDYLHSPVVVVDLTTSTVLVSEPSRESEEPLP
jgi:hypothetical protein